MAVDSVKYVTIDIKWGCDIEANEYQILVWQTAKPFYKCESADSGTFSNLKLATIVLALTGETGELAAKIRKMIENGEYLDHNFKEIFIEELGDILWVVAATATILGIKLSDVMGQNIGKLRERYPQGLSDNVKRTF